VLIVQEGNKRKMMIPKEDEKTTQLGIAVMVLHMGAVEINPKIWLLGAAVSL
jgi:hypothetical protein